MGKILHTYSVFTQFEEHGGFNSGVLLCGVPRPIQLVLKRSTTVILPDHGSDHVTIIVMVMIIIIKYKYNK